MAAFKVAVLLFTLAVASALPQPKFDWPDRPSWWPEKWDWPPQHPEWIPWPPTHPEWIPWPPQWPEEAPSWWPESQPWPPQWPPVWPEEAPSWWPDKLPWPPTEHPEWIPWPPVWPPVWPEEAPSWWPESQPWPPQWPPVWPEEAPSWWPDKLPWPPTEHPEWIPWPPQLPEINPDDIPYIPSRDNQFHLFTRNNPSVSQPLLFDNANLLAGSNYDPSLKTFVLIHGLGGSATEASNTILVPALLQGGDVNVIVVDWSAGASSSTALSTLYSVFSGNFVARFLEWLATTSNSDLGNFHLIGVGIGGLNAGFIGRRLDSKVGQVTALDPSRGPTITTYLPPLNANVAKYTEVIHTDAGNTGYSPPLGDVDFYPNSGRNQPGCGGDSACNRLRAVFFFAESVTSGGFTGVECADHREALAGTCSGEGRLNMGGLESKAGSSGVYYLTTNAAPPFSQG